MTFNINKIPDKDKKRRDAAAADEHDLRTKQERRMKENPADTSMTLQDYERMYNDGYIEPGIKVAKITCRHCGKDRECAVSSKMYHTKVCMQCNRKRKKGLSSPIEI